MKEWIPLVDDYLHELLRNDGRGGHTYSRCLACTDRPIPTAPGHATIRCRECMPKLVCEGCAVRRHADMPWHRVEVRFTTFSALTYCSSSTAMDWIHIREDVAC